MAQPPVMPLVTASVQVCFVRLGTFQHAIDFRALMEWRSNLFSVVSTEQSLDHLPDPRIEGGFSDAELEEQLRPTNNGNGLTIGITDAALSGGFYLRRLSDNRAVISVYDVAEEIKERHCSVESFILRNAYQLVIAYYNFNGVIPPSISKLSHDEVRGCVFDFNVNKFDVVRSLNKPILCKPCRGKIAQPHLKDLLPKLDAELKKIRKPLFFRIVDFVEKRPIASLIITLLTGLALNIAASFIYDRIK